MKQNRFTTETQRHRGKTVLRCYLCLCASVVFAIPAHATTFYLTISGLGGEPDYVQRFKGVADDIDSTLKKAGGDANVITLVAPTRDQIRARFGEIDRQANIALKGHAELLEVNGRYIMLGNVTPNNLGEVVLSLHFQAGMRASLPRVQLDRAPDGDDQIGFIRLKLAAEAKRISLTWDR